MNNNNGRYRNVTNNNEQWLGNQWRFKFLDSDIKSLTGSISPTRQDLAV